MNNFEHFNKLHQQTEPLIIGNVWNAQSARVLEKLKFEALATSSAAVAETLGYADGEEMRFDEYLFVIKRIIASTTLPLSVDLETGYGKTISEIVANMKQLYEMGVVGINIEDSHIQNGNRKILDAEIVADKLDQISSAIHAANIKIFINVRCDSFLMSVQDARKDAIRRLKLYELQGIHGLFLPCITELEDIKAVVNSTRLPVNVMCMPGLPDFEVLKSVGVKRISMGNFLNRYLYDEMEKKTQQIMSSQNFSSLFN